MNKVVQQKGPKTVQIVNKMWILLKRENVQKIRRTIVPII